MGGGVRLRSVEAPFVDDLAHGRRIVAPVPLVQFGPVHVREFVGHRTVEGQPPLRHEHGDHGVARVALPVRGAVVRRVHGAVLAPRNRVRLRTVRRGHRRAPLLGVERHTSVRQRAPRLEHLRQRRQLLHHRSFPRSCSTYPAEAVYPGSRGITPKQGRHVENGLVWQWLTLDNFEGKEDHQGFCWSLGCETGFEPCRICQTARFLTSGQEFASAIPSGVGEGWEARLVVLRRALYSILRLYALQFRLG